MRVISRSTELTLDRSSIWSRLSRKPRYRSSGALKQIGAIDLTRVVSEEEFRPKH